MVADWELKTTACKLETLARAISYSVLLRIKESEQMLTVSSAFSSSLIAPEQKKKELEKKDEMNCWSIQYSKIKFKDMSGTAH